MVRAYIAMGYQIVNTHAYLVAGPGGADAIVSEVNDEAEPKTSEAFATEQEARAYIADAIVEALRDRYGLAFRDDDDRWAALADKQRRKALRKLRTETMAYVYKHKTATVADMHDACRENGLATDAYYDTRFDTAWSVLEVDVPEDACP